jgi:hypothetical protein
MRQLATTNVRPRTERKGLRSRPRRLGNSSMVLQDDTPSRPWRFSPHARNRITHRTIDDEHSCSGLARMTSSSGLVFNGLKTGPFLRASRPGAPGRRERRAGDAKREISTRGSCQLRPRTCRMGHGSPFALRSMAQGANQWPEPGDAGELAFSNVEAHGVGTVRFICSRAPCALVSKET